MRISRIITGLVTLAGSAFIFPLSIHPDAMQNCTNPEFHFVMSDALGTTVEDTSNAKDQYCKTVEKNTELWGL
jgi:hypothetical protein